MALLRSASRGAVSFEDATKAFKALMSAACSAGKEPHLDFVLCCLGVARNGFDLDWDQQFAQQWLAEHRQIYAFLLLQAFDSWYGAERAMGRLRRQEFRALDPETFAGMRANIAILGDVRDRGSQYLAELLVPLARHAKQSEEGRLAWRKLLAALEVSGERLAWQVLDEIADRV